MAGRLYSGCAGMHISARFSSLNRAIPTSLISSSCLSQGNVWQKAPFPSRPTVRRFQIQRGGVSCMLSPEKGSQQMKQFSTEHPSPSVEHVVFFKVKDDPESEVLFEELRALKSLDVVSDLCAGKVLQVLGANFTHALHSRHPNKAALDAYGVHPSHQAVVKKLAPFIEDRLAVDWEAVPVGPPVEGGHGAARISLIKLCDGITEEDESQVFALLNGLREKLPFIRQISVGLNFSPARAKGFNMAFAALFDSVEELDQMNGNKELHTELRRSRVSPYMESFVIVDIDSRYSTIQNPAQVS